MAKARMAKEALKWLFKSPQTGKVMETSEIVGRLLPETLFAGLEVAMTPGNLGDKLSAGAGTLVGGATGGLVLGKLSKNPGISGALDLAGSIGGDFAGRAVAGEYQKLQDRALGGKGQTAYERDSEAYMNQYAQQIRQQTLAELGMVAPQSLGIG